MFILRDILRPLQDEFSSIHLGRQRSRWFVYTLLAFIVSFTSSISSNILRSLNTLFGLSVNRRCLEIEVNALKGSPESDMDWNACVEKFKKCAAYSAKTFSSDSIDILIDRVMNLERLENVSLLSESLVA